MGPFGFRHGDVVQASSFTCVVAHFQLQPDEVANSFCFLFLFSFLSTND